ncbi:unnamed protein product [Dovyalis caffra]|uniref:Uncharacterized protein n=1 Tax=Dovyalis caffra TaxID=77055 RepID=A0AAV1S737_9ROSI|nr:unnamed protein product [Dovyalis caffra]
MAATIVSKSLISHCTRHHTPLKSPPLIPLYLSHRHRSSKPQLFEINLSSPSLKSDGGNGSEEDDGFLIKRLEEILHRVILQKSTPDWLPFRPGSSFWVPPMISVKDVVHKYAVNSRSDEQTLSLANCCGWPSSSYFIKAGINVEMKEEEEEDHAEVKVELPEEVEGKVIVQDLIGATYTHVEVKEEKGQVDVKGIPKEGYEVEREVSVQGDEVEGIVEVLILAGSSLEDVEE